MFKMGKRSKTVKVLATALVSVMAFATPAMALSSSYINNRPIGNGTVYYSGMGQSSSGAAQVNYVEYKPNADISPIVVYGNKLYGLSNINTIAKYEEGLANLILKSCF